MRQQPYRRSQPNNREGAHMMMEVQTYERMATMEAKLGTIESLLTKLDDKFDNLNNAYVPRAEIDVLFRQRDDKLDILMAEVALMKQNKQNSKALIASWAAVLVAIIALVAPLVIPLVNNR
jgi:hypothetical protein